MRCVERIRYQSTSKQTGRYETVSSNVVARDRLQRIQLANSGNAKGNTMNHNPEKPLARRNALSRAFRWLSRKLEVAYWLGASEARLEADERAKGLIGRQANDF